jgi:SAM-dependent methyltransferase
MSVQDDEVKVLPPLPCIADIPKSPLRKDVWSWNVSDVLTFSAESLKARRMYIPEFGFVLLTEEVVAALVREVFGIHRAGGHGSMPELLDAGSGTGFLAEVLARRGIGVCASDIGELGYYHQRNLGDEDAPATSAAYIWRRDHDGDALALLPGAFDFVLLSWPPFWTEFALHVVRKMKPGQVLLYEGDHGCTGTAEFFSEIESDRWVLLAEESERINDVHSQWENIHDEWLILRKVAK